MATSWRSMMFFNVLIVMGGHHLCSAGDLDEMNERLSTLEANQERLQQLLESAQDAHNNQIQQAFKLLQDIQQRVQDQKETMERIKQTLGIQENNGHQQNNSSDADAMNGPCLPENHVIINDSRRAINGEYEDEDDLCDSELEPGWYRFLLEGCSAVIPTACVPENHCQTDAPTWIDMQGESSPSVGQEVSARACSHWNGNCCNFEANIVVRNCGKYFVYRIEPLSTCDLSFCVKPQF